MLRRARTGHGENGCSPKYKVKRTQAWKWPSFKELRVGCPIKDVIMVESLADSPESRMK